MRSTSVGLWRRLSAIAVTLLIATAWAPVAESATARAGPSGARRDVITWTASADRMGDAVNVKGLTACWRQHRLFITAPRSRVPLGN
ncbi:hypothetical protein ACWFRM_10730 [Streptomyces sp. NPDC055144]